jgi:hypothetical protein
VKGFELGCQRAISSASTTSSERRWSAIDHPTIRREYASISAAQ